MTTSDDAFLPLADAMRLVYGSEKIPSPKTVKKWIKVGISGITLPAVRTCDSPFARYRITPRRLREWIDRVQNKKPSVPEPSELDEERAVESALREIDEM